MKHYKIKIEGKVQSVWFRVSARDEARRLGLKGFVRNESDGSVYAEAEGEEQNLTDFITWCNIGPDQSEVTNVDVTEGEIQGFEDFNVAE